MDVRRRDLIPAGLLLALAVSPLLGACASHGDSAPPAAVQVEHHSETHTFRVTWTLPEDARALIFVRGAGFRDGLWSPIDKSESFAFKAGHDVLEAPTPTRSFAVDIREGLIEVPGDYSLLTPFSDGGQVLFTGHLGAIGLNCLGPCSEGEVADRAGEATLGEASVVPAAGERVVVDGEVGARSASGVAPAAGAMVYFGNRIPIESGAYRVIADPQLPAWVSDDFQDLFPRVLDLDSRKLGASLQKKPTVFVPYGGNFSSANSNYLGSVVGSSMVLELIGNGWEAHTYSAKHRFAQLVAHESFHLWNAGLYHSDSQPGGMWLHEGSADAFSYLTLLELGEISNAQFEDDQNQALNRCLLGLGTASLSDTTHGWNMHDAYDCGATLESWLSRDLTNKGSDLWAFWAELFKSASQKTGVEQNLYTHQDFFDAARAWTSGTTVAASMQKLLGAGGVSAPAGGSPTPPFTVATAAVAAETLALQVYADLGVAISAHEGDWPAWYAHFAAQRAVSASLDHACGANAYFLVYANSLAIYGGPSCSALYPASAINEVGNHELWREGVEVYDYISQQCSSSHTFLLGDGRGLSAQMSCPVIGRRPPYLALDLALDATDQ